VIVEVVDFGREWCGIGGGVPFVVDVCWSWSPELSLFMNFCSEDLKGIVAAEMV